MNQCAIQQNAFSERRHNVICPKPRRVGLLIDQPSRSLRWHLSHQTEVCDSNGGSDLLDIILHKGGCGVEQHCNTQLALSSPFLFGTSPPSRVANPLIHDTRFGDENFPPCSPLLPTPSSTQSSSPSSAVRKGGYVRANFGNKPEVRIEGFDCLDRDRRNCGIPTLA